MEPVFIVRYRRGCQHYRRAFKGEEEARAFASRVEDDAAHV